MALITPEQLAVEYTSQTLNSLAHLIVVQPDGSGHISLEDLKNQLLISLQDSELTQEILDTLWQSPLNAVSEVLPDLAEAVHTHSPNDVGLGNVSNMPKEDLPISLSQQQSLNTKLDADTLIAPSITVVTPREW